MSRFKDESKSRAGDEIEFRFDNETKQRAGDET